MADWLFRFLKGAIIGIGAILPGISGGVLCVVLGVYQPMMAFLAHPVRTFRENVSYLLPVLLGWVAGVLGLARAISWLLDAYPTPCVWLFVGLVCGTLPSLFAESGRHGRGAASWAALVTAGALMGGWLWLLARHGGGQVTPNIAWWVLCGVLWGLGLIVPGLSPSSFFIFFGLYEPMTAAIGSLDMSVLLPMGAGLAAAVLLLARGMNHLLEKRYALVMHAILGVVIASTLAILPLNDVGSGWNAALYALCFALGCAAAYGLDHLGKTLESRKKSEKTA